MKIIYCDGSSLGNPGPGAWAVVALDTDKKLVWEYGEKRDNVTNNQMELQACIFALKLILTSSQKANKKDTYTSTYELRLDSKYVIQGATEWLNNWVKNNWKNSQKKVVLNKDLWQEVLDLKNHINSLHVKLKWTHVYGHSGEEWNERVDEIARTLASNKQIVLRKGEHI